MNLNHLFHSDAEELAEMIAVTVVQLQITGIYSCSDSNTAHPQCQQSDNGKEVIAPPADSCEDTAAPSPEFGKDVVALPP